MNYQWLAGEPANDILDRLRQLRADDAPTHGGELLSYVYDSGLAELDELAAEAVKLTLPVNGLDPTTFTSVPAMERDLIAFTKRILHGERGRGHNKVVGSITSGGTESCLLAVKTARDYWQAQRASHRRAHGTPRLLAPRTVHAAFHKAAHYFGLKLDLVPVAADGSVQAKDLIGRMGDDVALVVVSAPSYPTAQLDPVAEVAAAALTHGISCHVDACIGGFALPWWNTLDPWDFRVAGVTSISADLHKFGYAPKGASVLLQRGRERQRHQFFATRSWPGYPVVNPTMLGSRSATGLAAAWAIVQHLGVPGYQHLTTQARRATESILAEVEQISGLKVLGQPTGPLFALVADENVSQSHRVDPHHFADRMRVHGFTLQHQPGFAQADGATIAHSVHFTVTPITEQRLPELLAAMRLAAAEARGRPRSNPRLELTALRLTGLLREDATLSPGKARLLLKTMGMGSKNSELPTEMAPLMRILEELPTRVAESVLIELIARLGED